MSTLYTCVHAAEFPAQAILRLRPDFQGQPVAVMEGRPPHEFVCAMNLQARRMGVTLGMTELETDELPGLHLVKRCLTTEAAARAVLLECAAQFSPRVEETSQGTSCSFILDIAGSERLFGTPAQLAERLRKALTGAGFRVSVAVSVNFHAARMVAAAMRGTTVIPAGADADALATLPLTALDLDEDPHLTFALWGIRTLGELAALPEVELITRLGQHARAWRALAHGQHPHMFQPLEPEFTLREYCAFETPVEQMDSMLFIGARMIDCLITRAVERAFAISSLTVRMQLECDQQLQGNLPVENGQGSRHVQLHELTLRPAIPSSDRKFLLKLLQLEIAAHPPQAAVLALELIAEAGKSGSVQLGLFAPQTPEPSRLDVTLARLKAIVGEDRVGSPVLEDTHRPGSFHLQPFVLPQASSPDANPPRMALRRVRPALPVRVTQHEQRPAAFASLDERFQVTAAYGPWKTSGCWWSGFGEQGAWDLEEWDVLAERSNGASVACLLVRDCARNEWRLEAFYD